MSFGSLLATLFVRQTVLRVALPALAASALWAFALGSPPVAALLTLSLFWDHLKSQRGRTSEVALSEHNKKDALLDGGKISLEDYLEASSKATSRIIDKRTGQPMTSQRLFLTGDVPLALKQFVAFWIPIAILSWLSVAVTGGQMSFPATLLMAATITLAAFHVIRITQLARMFAG